MGAEGGCQVKSQVFVLCLIALLGVACYGCSAQGKVTAPAGEEPAPAGEEPALTGDEPAPAGDTPAPAGEAPAPSGSAPAGSQVAPTLTAPELAGAQIVATNDIVGIWELSTHAHWKPAYWLVREDGSYSFSPQPDGSSPSQSGKYWFENNLLMIRDDFCPTPGSYRIRKFNTSPVTIRMELVEDSCEARIKILTGAPAAWTLPLR
jgi:hypothetical protein